MDKIAGNVPVGRSGLQDFVSRLEKYLKAMDNANSELERSDESIRHTFREQTAEQELLQPILRAFRGKDKEALVNFDDAYPAFIDDLILKGNLTPEKPAGLMSTEGEISEEPEVKILIDQKENIGLQSRANLE